MKAVQSFVVILIAYFCFIPHKGNAQEMVFVNLDKNVIVSGESVFFKAYLVNSNTISPDSHSRILYFQITDPVTKNNLVFRSDINKNGTSYGEIPIPDTLSTGFYLLTAYTNYMRNFNPGQVYTTRILVINQARNIPDELNTIVLTKPSDLTFKTSDPLISKSNNIDISLDRKIYGTREKVTIGLKNLADTLSISDVSITVTRKNPFDDPGSFETNICSYLPYIANKIQAGKDQSKLNPGTIPCKYPKEDKGYIVSGNMIDKISKKPISNAFVLLSVPDSIANLKYAVTDSLGKFCFLLEKKYNNRQLILQPKDSPVVVENTTISLEEKAIDQDKLTLQNVILDSAGSDFLITCQQTAMIHKIYASKIPKDTLGKEKPIQEYCFFGKPDEIIRPSEFLEMPNLEDIVANIVRNAKYKVTEDHSSILVLDELSHQFWEGNNALVLLNTIPVFDYGVLNSLGSRQIQRIELKTKRMYYGDLEIYGIISIFTKENYIPALELENQVVSFPNEVLVPVKSNQFPDYSLAGQKNSKIPDFRQTLYWDPEFEIKNRTKNTIEFYTSDLKTSYDIVIQGITQNGIPLSARTTIEVR